MTNDDLTYAMRECGHLYSALGIMIPRMEEFTHWDGMIIPPNKKLRVTAEYIDIPDPEITLEIYD